MPNVPLEFCCPAHSNPRLRSARRFPPPGRRARRAPANKTIPRPRRRTAARHARSVAFSTRPRNRRKSQDPFYRTAGRRRPPAGEHRQIRVRHPAARAWSGLSAPSSIHRPPGPALRQHPIHPACNHARFDQRNASLPAPRRTRPTRNRSARCSATRRQAMNVSSVRPSRTMDGRNRPQEPHPHRLQHRAPRRHRCAPN